MGVQINGDTGNISATKADYSGNVTIGGTLTYEDVTNIDSVGLVTARSGIEIGASPGVAASISVDGNMIVSGITTISTVKVGGGVTISESGIEASGIGITCANINGTQIGGRRNLIINGAMQVAQRGTSSTSTGYQTVDRITTTTSGGIDNACTYAQVNVSSGTTPYTNGFRKAFKITNGDQSSIATNDYVYFSYNFEAQDIANSGWNYTSSSSFITLSFWVKSSVAQEFHGYLKTNDGTAQLYSFSTGSLTADTWTKVIKTIPGNSNLQFDNDINTGFILRIAGYMGTYRTGSLTQNQWAAYDSSVRYPNFTDTWFDTNDSTLEFTGLQLEVGSQATPFEHRSFGEELSLCQRYYYKHVDGNTKTVTENGTHYTGAYIFASFTAPTAMRTAPSVEVVTGSAYYVTHSNGQQTGTFSGTGVASSYNTENYLSIQTSEGGGTQGHATIWRTNNASARIGYNAEL